MLYGLHESVTFRRESFGAVMSTELGLFMLTEDEFDNLLKFENIKEVNELNDFEKKLLENHALSEIK